jgi:hypothetical protein
VPKSSIDTSMPPSCSWRSLPKAESVRFSSMPSVISTATLLRAMPWSCR